jgi:hypothetical protein
MLAFSMSFLIWTCDEIVIPSTPVDFPAFAAGRPANVSGYAAANSAARQPGAGEIAPEFLALAERPKSAPSNGKRGDALRQRSRPSSTLPVANFRILYRLFLIRHGRREIRAERDPERLATHKHSRIRASRKEIAQSLEGTWRPVPTSVWL